MASTTKYTVTTSWTEVASGLSNVLVQQSGFNPVAIHVGGSAPNSDSAFIVMNRSRDPASGSMSLGSLGDTDKVYARALRTGSTADVTVLSGD